MIHLGSYRYRYSPECMAREFWVVGRRQSSTQIVGIVDCPECLRLIEARRVQGLNAVRRPHMGYAR